MPVVQKELMISAPAERIFGFVTDPGRLPEYAPGVASVSEIKQTSGHVGDSFKVAYSVLNLKFPMTFTTEAYREPAGIDLHMDGNMVGAWQWRLAQEGGATRVRVSIDYKLKLGLLGKAMNALLVERMNEKNTETMLANLKEIIERN
jgi:carbon monoxide dehydrogenase subunit G